MFDKHCSSADRLARVHVSIYTTFLWNTIINYAPLILVQIRCYYGEKLQYQRGSYLNGKYFC